jgi:pyruvate dehydrogenase (quinone)
VQIDLDPNHIGLRVPAEVGLVGDCRQTLAALLPLLQRKSDRGFLEKAQERMRDWNKLMAARASVTSTPIKPQVAVAALNRFINDDAIVVSDCGTVTTWAARHIQLRGEMQFIVSGLLATMACGLPYAVGAAVAHPGRQVVALVGDGGATMLLGELATLVKYQLPVKVMVIKNNALGEIKWEQLVLEGNPEFGVELQPIDFAGVAKACGAAAFRLEDPTQAEAVAREAFAVAGPALIEATVDPLEPPMPGKISTQQAIHFAEALLRGESGRAKILKTVLKDKVREVI